MQYRQHQLDNGLTVLAECNPHAHMAAYGFFVKAGARDEIPETGGVSHFLGHMAFKGTPRRSAEEVNLRLDELGSSSNARTGEESTIYHAAVLPEFQSEIVELLADIMRPSLREDDFETEKQVIIEEIRMYADQPPYGGHERIMSEYFGNHPLGQSVLGTVETVSQLTPERMREYFQQRYSPQNMAFAAAGQVDFEKLVEDLERHCGDWTNLGHSRQTERAEPVPGFGSLVQSTANQEYLLQLAPSPASVDAERFAARALASVIGDDSGSRLYWEFVDPGLAESAGMGVYEYLDNGVFLTFVACDPDQAQSNLDRLRTLQLKIVQEGIQARELELAKRKIASRIVLGSERTENRMFSVGSQWLTGQPFLSVAEIARRYDALTLGEVNAVLEKYPLATGRMLAVGPHETLAAVD